MYLAGLSHGLVRNICFAFTFNVFILQRQLDRAM